MSMGSSPQSDSNSALPALSLGRSFRNPPRSRRSGSFSLILCRNPTKNDVIAGERVFIEQNRKSAVKGVNPLLSHRNVHAVHFRMRGPLVEHVEQLKLSEQLRQQKHQDPRPPRGGGLPRSQRHARPVYRVQSANANPKSANPCATALCANSSANTMTDPRCAKGRTNSHRGSYPPRH